MNQRFRSFTSFTVCAALAAGCGGSDSSSAGTSGDPGPSAPSPGGGGAPGPVEPGACTEVERFSSQSYGTNSDDLIRHVAYDEPSGNLYFSVMDDMYLVPSGADEPERLGPRPNDHIGGGFWLAEDQILFPSGTLIPLIEGTRAVLFSTDRDVQDSEVVVGVPVPESYEYEYDVGEVFVRGDEVLWIGIDRYTDNPARIPPEWQSTYVLRRTSWTNPGTAEELYSTTRWVRDVVLAGDLAFLEEQIDAEGFGEYRQTIVDLATGTVDPESTEEKFGGQVVGGNDESLFVSKLDLEDLENTGVFRTAPDGSGAELVATNAFVELIVEHGERWVFVDPQGINDPILVNEYEVGQGVTQVGCIDGQNTTAHALTLEGDDILVSIFRGNESVVLTFGE